MCGSVSWNDRIYVIVWAFSGLICLVIGGALIWEAVMEIMRPGHPHRNVAYVCVTMIFGIITCCIFLIPAIAVCVEVFLNWWKTAPRLPLLFGTQKIVPLPTSTSADGTHPSTSNLAIIIVN